MRVGCTQRMISQSIKMFASYDKDEDGITFGDRTMIPRHWVKKIQKI